MEVPDIQYTRSGDVAIAGECELVGKEPSGIAVPTPGRVTAE
jgi:hypothetical protein